MVNTKLAQALNDAAHYNKTILGNSSHLYVKKIKLIYFNSNYNFSAKDKADSYACGYPFDLALFVYVKYFI
jgi:hypothetical protein